MLSVAIDFDNTIVRQKGRPYSDTTTPLEFLEGARNGVHALKRAGHLLLLWSARSSPALLVDPELDPLVRAGKRRIDRAAWEKALPVHRARHAQMLAFVAKELPGLFDAIDDGAGGKPQVDLFIDDRALRLGDGASALGWNELMRIYGAPFAYGRLRP